MLAFVHADGSASDDDESRWRNESPVVRTVEGFRYWNSHHTKDHDIYFVVTPSGWARVHVEGIAVWNEPGAHIHYDGSVDERYTPSSSDDSTAAMAFLIGHVDHECAECRTPVFGEAIKKWAADVRVRLDERKLCFGCLIWTEHLEEKSSRIVRVKGVQYRIGEKTSAPDHCKGFGGSRYKIKFFDGRKEESTNLWCNGDIPPHFRDRMPDNAEFVKADPEQSSRFAW